MPEIRVVSPEETAFTNNERKENIDDRDLKHEPESKNPSGHENLVPNEKVDQNSLLGFSAIS